MSAVRHPAKFTDVILDTILEMWPDDAHGPILDPFAGTGKVHLLADQLGLDSVGLELEPEWARQAPTRTLDPAGASLTIIGNALRMPFPAASFGSVVTSPCYGNRMADSHEAKDECRRCLGWGWKTPGIKDMPCPACDGTGLSRRNTYTHALGRKLHQANAGAMQWGAKYRNFHDAAWWGVNRILELGGYFFLNVKDHIRDGKIVPVSAWHRDCVRTWRGFALISYAQVKTPGQRQGKNGELRVEHENVFLFKKISVT